MAHKRIKSSRFQGVYWRETTDPLRRHNGRPDRCYDFCYREHGKLKWVVVGWASEGYSEQKASNMRAEALRSIANVEDYAQERSEKITMDEAAKNYFAWMEGEGKHVKQEKNRYEKHAKGSIGHLPIGAISSSHVDTLKVSMLKTHSPASVLKLLATCRAIANYSVRTEQWNGINPFGRERLSMPKPQNKGERFLTPQEALDLLNALEAKSPQLRDMAWLSLKTGLRSTEIFRLTGADVDMTGGVLWITEKGGRRVAVRVEKEVLDLLAGYQCRAGEYIFKSRNGEKLKQISDSFERACTELKLMPGNPEDRAKMDSRKKVWFHTLRHTFASWLAQSGTVTLIELRDLMRHSSIVMTERYAHLIPGKSQEKTAIIGDILSKAGDAEEKSDREKRPPRPTR